MKLKCPSCRHDLEFSGDRPSFCAYCGQALDQTWPESKAEYDRDAATMPPSAADAGVNVPASETVAGYRLLRLLGSGGMGKVYEAEDTRSGRRVALKLIASGAATSKEAVDRFRQEGRLASTIVHPRCVFVLAADECAGQPYIVMELMSGTTLQDLVQKHGPLPVEEAVAKILDVIEGLQEAHQLGVIHRDVKPSNCFVESQGRVKIGDFGLAKSLVADPHLTKTGSFLGTPLYASPEQVKAECVDQQTDVYSVAATLYFLLTGRAPFQSRDAAATVARIVSDPPASMRSLRPEVPASLDQIVLRGLERQRQRRWRSLDDLRTALLPFSSSQLSIAGPVLRVAAYVIDIGMYVPLGALAALIGTSHFAPAILRDGLELGIPWFLYFVVLEALWGCSLGKRCLRLRVYSARGNHLAGLQKVLLRTLCFYLLADLPGSVISVVYPMRPGHGPLEPIAIVLLRVLGSLILALPMRARNGYRGIHELLSGTRVVRLPAIKKRRTLPGRPLEKPLLHPDGLPDMVGAFRVRGLLYENSPFRILAAEDPALGRQVWIHLRPAGSPPWTAARREINRPTRLRWLACGEQEEMQWDAFLAPAGCPLPNAIYSSGRLSWPEVRTILEQLTDELDAACQDKTLPQLSSVEQVWIQGNGRIQLIEHCLGSVGDKAESSRDSEQNAALSLVHQVAILTLEGRPRPAETAGAPIQAPMPTHAATLLNRLFGVDGKRLKTIQQLRAQWAATREQPAEITTAHRAAHLAMLTLAFSIPVFIMFLLHPFVLVMVSYVSIQALDQEIAGQQRVLKDFQSGMQHDFVFSLFQPNALVRTHGLVRLHADMHLEESLQQRINKRSALKEHLHRSAGWMTTALLTATTVPLVSIKEESAVHSRRPTDFRQAAERELRTIHIVPFEFGDYRGWGSLAIFIAGFPLSCVLWAFAVRGGFLFRLAGIVLLGANGRKASRMQCAWRAALFWIPVIMLLAVPWWLDGLVMAAWIGQNPEPLYGRASWLSWVCWVLALGLFPVYLSLALWLPNRSLHDRLAGTYLVPR